MTTVNLQILAKDILETNYFISNDCAITRALKRADIEACDVDGEISNGKTGRGRTTIDGSNKTYQNLSWKVICMYMSKTLPVGHQIDEGTVIAPEDFECTLELDI